MKQQTVQQEHKHKANLLRLRVINFFLAVILSIVMAYIYFFTSWAYRGIAMFFFYIPFLCILLLMPWVYDAVEKRHTISNDRPSE
jgi:hypothetical protein